MVFPNRFWILIGRGRETRKSGAIGAQIASRSQSNSWRSNARAWRSRTHDVAMTKKGRNGLLFGACAPCAAASIWPVAPNSNSQPVPNAIHHRRRFDWQTIRATATINDDQTPKIMGEQSTPAERLLQRLNERAPHRARCVRPMKMKISLAIRPSSAPIVDLLFQPNFLASKRTKATSDKGKTKQRRRSQIIIVIVNLQPEFNFICDYIELLYRAPFRSECLTVCTAVCYGAGRGRELGVTFFRRSIAFFLLFLSM